MTRRHLARRKQSLIIEENPSSMCEDGVLKTSENINETQDETIEKQRYRYFENIFNDYKNDLKRYLLKSVHQEDVAEDILQDVFVRLIRYKNDIPEKSMKGFLFVTSANLIKDRYRRQQVRQASLKDPVYSADLNVSHINPEIIVKHKQSLGLLKKALDDMDQKYHTAFTLYRFHNKKHDEIATIMGVTSRSVRNYIREAMLLLNQKLQAN